MPYLHVIILAVVQGLTEFLPVSSSGHLVVVNALLEAAGRQPLGSLVEVNIVLHLGTLTSVLVFYRRQIGPLVISALKFMWQVAVGTLKAVREFRLPREYLSSLWRSMRSDPNLKVILLLMVGTVPAVVVGLPLKKLLPEVLESALLAGLLFPVTAALLIGATRKFPGQLGYEDLSSRQSLLVGLFQAAAILPGVSRSGATIVAGLEVGMRRTDATSFAFLLAIPAIAGAGILEFLEMVQDGGSSTPAGALIVGFLVSMTVGLASLWWLIRWVKRGTLHRFAYWLIPLGIAVTTWQLWP